LARDTILTVIAQGAWNGGTVVDNSIFENKNMFFKGNIPVNNQTIEDRIGVRTRVAAYPDERIGVVALQNLLENDSVDPKRIKMVIGATNVGEDKYDRGPLIRHPYEILKGDCPDALAFDLYAGCPGYNVSVELAFMLSLSGRLSPGDITVIVGAENLHRAQAFRPDDTAHIIFGDDALATALETMGALDSQGTFESKKIPDFTIKKDPVVEIAEHLLPLAGNRPLDGLILDNHLGTLVHRLPATAARVQHALMERLHPEAADQGQFLRFKDALDFYDRHTSFFAFDIMTLNPRSHIVEEIAKAYVQSGKYRRVASVFLSTDLHVKIAVHEGMGYVFRPPAKGIVDTLTRTHGCFADYIHISEEADGVFGKMDGKGVFLYATRSAPGHLSSLLSPHGLTLADMDLLIEHQANFAIIPLTLEQVFNGGPGDLKQTVADFVANKMATNIHTRGNCSVVCMQRLPYDLQRGFLQPDTIQRFPINRNLEKLKHAKTILSDSVGAGMTRSAFLQRL